MNISIKNIYRYLKYFRIIKMIIFKKPLLIIRVIGNYFKIFILKQRIVRKAEMGVTFDCQCNCEKCSSVFMKNTKKEFVSLDKIKKTAREIISLGTLHVNLTGGEPLLQENIFEIIRCFQPKKVVITINTNGLLLSRGMIDKLEKAGVDIIKISIDSPIAEEHDQSRGYDGCFKQAMTALAYIKKKKGIIGQISTVCIKENLNSYRIWRLVEISRSYNALLGLTIPAVSGGWLDKKGILLDEKEAEILKKLSNVTHVIRDTDEAYMRSHCPAGSEEFYLTCYGDIIPCPLIQISFGNIKYDSVKTIWKRMSEFKEFKRKKHSGCLAGEDRVFIERYLRPLKDFGSLPITVEEHPATRG